MLEISFVVTLSFFNDGICMADVSFHVFIDVISPQVVVLVNLHLGDNFLCSFSYTQMTLFGDLKHSYYENKSQSRYSSFLQCFYYFFIKNLVRKMAGWKIFLQ